MNVKRYTRVQLKKHLPRRLKQDSKVQGGRVAILAGSAGMWGAALLSAQGASRCGAGYVYLPQATRRYLSAHPDFLYLTEGKIKKLKFSSCVIGPGFQHPQKIARWITFWKKQKQSNVVLDAEALNWLAKNPRTKLPKDWVLTPHEGEMARLLGRSREWVHHHRIQALQMAQKRWGCVVLLKGPGTLVTDGQHLFEMTSGNPALGKAGSGDVLSGMIAAFLAQKKPQISIVQMVCAAAYLHGFIADQWIKKNDILSLRPIDLIEGLPQALKSLR